MERRRRPDRAARRGAGAGADAAARPASGPIEVDHARFPDVETRRSIDDGAASRRFRELLDEGGPILADGAMGTMLFSAGLQFGDPPETWNLSQPDIVRRIHRGYLDAGARILLTNTFGGNRHRRSLHNLENRVAQLNRTAAVLLKAEVRAAGGHALVAGDIGPSGQIMAPLGTLERDDAIETFEEQVLVDLPTAKPTEAGMAELHLASGAVVKPLVVIAPTPPRRR